MPQAIAFLFPAFATTATYTFLTGTVGSLLTSVALSALTANLGRPSIPPPEDVKGNYISPTAARSVHIGRVKVGGVRGMEPRTKDGKIYLLLVQGHGLIDGREQHFIDGVEVNLDFAGNVTNTKYQHDGNSMLRILTRDGLPTETYYSEIEAAFPDWDSDHRLDGLSTALLIADAPPASAFQAMFPNRLPEYNSIERGKPFFDPRTGLGQWSENPALAIRDYLQNVMGITSHWDDVNIVAANDCDALRTTPIGDVKQFTIGGTYLLTSPHKDNLEAMLKTCQGRFVYNSLGEIGLRVGTQKQPTVTLTDDDLISTLNWHIGKSTLEGYNAVSAKYTDQSLGFVSQTSELWVDENSSLYSDKVVDLDATLVPEWTQVRYLQKALQQEGNPIEYGTLRFNLGALRAIGEEQINLDVQLTPTRRFTGVVSVGDIQLSSPLRYLDIPVSRLADDYGTITLEEYGEAPVVAVPDVSEGIPQVFNFNAVPSGVQGASGNFTAGIAAAWDAKTIASLSPLVEYGEVTPLNGGGFVISSWRKADVSNDSTRVQIPALTGGRLYHVRFAWVSANGTVGPYTTIEDVVAAASSTPPDDPTSFTVTDGTGGVALIEVTSSASEDNYITHIYRDGALIESVISPPSSLISVNDAVGAGSYDYTAQAESVTPGNTSSIIATTPTTTVIT